MLKQYLNNRFFRIFSFSLIEKGFEILIGILSNIFIIRYLDSEQYGIISYIASLSVIINIINIAPENYLYKMYNKLSSKDLSKYIKSYLIFDMLDGLLILIINVCVGLFLFKKYSNEIFLLVILFNGIALLITQAYTVLRVVLEINFQQKLLARTTIISKMLRLFILCVLLYSKSIIFVLIADVAFSVIQLIQIHRIFKKMNIISNPSKINIRSFIDIIKDSILTYSLWTHVTGILTSFIYSIDAFILGFFISIKQIGVYSISLNTANYFMIVFQVLQKNTTILLSDTHSIQEENRIISKMLVLSTIMALCQYFLFVLFGRYYLSLFTKSDIDIVYNYSIYIVLGITIFNCIRPLSSYLILKYDIKKYFMYSILPASIFTIILYVFAAWRYGAIGIAVSNSIAYLFWAFTHIAILKKSAFRFIRN